ncbi:MAG: zf-TFIIB domain-containing protein [Euryarchaeota archaeon]|nr:zf-TFIIB domain-containing protein [Euryarchaeota archaeon]
MKKAAKTRECPVDWVKLEPKKVVLNNKRDVTMDECPKCHGVFLDEHEIGRVTDNQNLNKLLTRYVGTDSDSARVCPSCGGVMDHEDAAGVKVDVCLTCYGVWLDGGELDHLKAKSEKDLETLSVAKQAELFDAGQNAARGVAGRSAFYRFLWAMKETLRMKKRY